MWWFLQPLCPSATPPECPCSHHMKTRQLPTVILITSLGCWFFLLARKKAARIWDTWLSTPGGPSPTPRRPGHLPSPSTGHGVAGCCQTLFLGPVFIWSTHTQQKQYQPEALVLGGEKVFSVTVICDPPEDHCTQQIHSVSLLLTSHGVGEKLCKKYL